MSAGNGGGAACGPFFGKYRGIVIANNDPDNLGRIRARVPDILGDSNLGWALPAVSYAGDDVGMYFIPPEQTSVWIEFEHGDIERPVWAGCFWDKKDKQGKSRLPAEPPSPDIKVIKTQNAIIEISDKAKSIRIEIKGGPKIVMSNQGILFDNGSGATVQLSGTTVSVNGDHLEVT